MLELHLFAFEASLLITIVAFARIIVDGEMAGWLPSLYKPDNCPL